MINIDYTAGLEELKDQGGYGIYINTNKGVKFELINLVTGEVLEADNFTKSLGAMRRKIFGYADVTSGRSELGNTYGLIELSYANNKEWRSNDIRDYIRSVRRIVGDDMLFDYAWVLEIKPEGKNLHYHLALHMDKKAYVPTPDESGMWVRGSSNIKRGEASPYYLVKYAGKSGPQKDRRYYPKGARKYGVWLNGTYYSDDEQQMVSKTSYPPFLQEKASDLGIELYKVERVKGGGWNIIKPDGQKIYARSTWVGRVVYSSEV